MSKQENDTSRGGYNRVLNKNETSTGEKREETEEAEAEAGGRLKS